MSGIGFSYGFNSPPTDVDYVRRLVGDIDGSHISDDIMNCSFLLSDVDIDAFITRSGGDLYLSASRLCLALAASNLIQARAVKLGQFETNNDAEAHWMTLSQRYQDISNMTALPLDAVVAWTETDMPRLVIYKALRGEQN